MNKRNEDIFASKLSQRRGPLAPLFNWLNTPLSKELQEYKGYVSPKHFFRIGVMMTLCFVGILGAFVAGGIMGAPLLGASLAVGALVSIFSAISETPAAVRLGYYPCKMAEKSIEVAGKILGKVGEMLGIKARRIEKVESGQENDAFAKEWEERYRAPSARDPNDKKHGDEGPSSRIEGGDGKGPSGGPGKSK